MEKEYIPRHVMEPGPYADRKITGTWKDYITVTKVGIIVSNMLTVVAGMWLAAGGWTGFVQLSVSQILLTFVGTAMIIASGTCLNNYIDRDIDQKMARTQSRALPAGRLDPRNVLIMGFLLATLGTVCLLLVNWVATLMAAIGLFFYVVVYTMWLKRTHHLNTIVGSVSGAMPPVIGWTSVTANLDPGAIIFFSIMFVWQIPHFLSLAMRRCEDYRAAGIPMLPVVRGFGITKQQIALWVAALIPTSLYLYLVSEVNWPYIILALTLGLGWLGLALSGFNVEDNIAWAKRNFFYSLGYLTFMCLGIILFTV